MKPPTAREWRLFAAVIDADITREEFAAAMGYDCGPGFNDANDRIADLYDAMRREARAVRDECRKAKGIQCPA